MQAVSELGSIGIPTTLPILKSDLWNFANTMDIARKMLKLFESLKVYGVLLKVVKSDMNKTHKFFVIANHCIMMVYWAAENLYVMSKLRILSFNSNLLLKLLAWIAILGYISSLIIRIRELKGINIEIEKLKKTIEPSNDEEARKLVILAIKEKLIRMNIIEETAYNLWTLQEVPLFEKIPIIKLISSLGNFLSGTLSLFIKSNE